MRPDGGQSPAAWTNSQSVASTVAVSSARGVLSARQAVERLRELTESGGLEALWVVDRQSGELLSPEARGLFAALPAVTPATAPEELVEAGLLTAIPSGLRQALEAPRYKVGRGVFVRATVNYKPVDRTRPVGDFSSTAPVGFTHRAQLRAMRADNFLVDIEGASAPVPVAKTDVFAWNEPTSFPSGTVSLSGVQIDYNDPHLKGHVCAALLAVAADIAALDFGDAAVAAAQARLISRIASRVTMTYAGRGDGYAGSRVGALLHGGQGVCFVQRAVAAALLAPMARLLAFDLQVAVGRTQRLGVAHGFLVVTLRPSLARFVVDPAWGEPLTDLRVACFGPGWGHDRRLEGFEGTSEVRVPPEAIALPEEHA